ncbi:ArsR/SmtB family transcription factor [Acidicapsa dinghuensis]|uniref:ArsR/SmtB family transcription factor n=1 Tax=Acidicapsa dinghuensis TaxID=2218256 RepID=A0ABW1EI40_9BACT|nr:ArsR family transcriptional regulator [Acidicapsa dinghuensis]
MAKLQPEPKTSELHLTAVLYALSDETRLQIVQSLTWTSEIACGYFDIDMPKSSLSHHFRVLRSAGVIATRKDGTALLNRLRREDLDEKFPGLLDSVLASMSRRKPNLRAKKSSRTPARKSTRVN